MGMYDDIVEGVSENIQIMGWPFYAENITADEPYNRREYNFNSIIGGTEVVTPGKYIHREFSFTTTIYFPTGRPDAYDKIFKEIMSKPVEVISKYMGGKFKALVTISKTNPESSLNHMDLDISIVEVPERDSKILGEEFSVPSKRVVEENKEKSTNNTISAGRNTISNLIQGKLSNKEISSKINSIAKKSKGE